MTADHVQQRAAGAVAAPLLREAALHANRAAERDEAGEPDAALDLASGAAARLATAIAVLRDRLDLVARR